MAHKRQGGGSAGKKRPFFFQKEREDEKLLNFSLHAIDSQGEEVPWSSPEPDPQHALHSSNVCARWGDDLHLLWTSASRFPQPRVAALQTGAATGANERGPDSCLATFDVVA